MIKKFLVKAFFMIERFSRFDSCLFVKLDTA